MGLALFSIQNAKPSDRPYMLSDGNGLHLLVNPNGSKLWRLRYRFGGKQKMLGLGSFPETSLAEARGKRNDAQKVLSAGIDPSQERKAQKTAAAVAATNTFGVIAKEYIEKLRAEGKSPRTIAKNKWLLEDLASPLTDRPITQITSAEILEILKKVEKTGRRESARRLRGTIGSVYRFAIANLKAENDPTYALRGALLQPNVRHRPAITDEKEVGALMRSIDEYDGWPTLRAALLLLALTMTRPGNVRYMRKADIIFPKSLWRIPAEQMKMRKQFDVPLSRQALQIIREMWDVTEGELVLPSIRSFKRPLSENAMNSALRRMGYAQDEHCAHGFRTTASTILNERGYNADHIEVALAHEEEDQVRRAYNRASYLPERTKMMQEWADLLDEFRVQSAGLRVA